MSTTYQSHYHLMENRSLVNDVWTAWVKNQSGFFTNSSVIYIPGYTVGNWRQRIYYRLSATTGLHGEYHDVLLANSDHAIWKGRYIPIPAWTSGSDWKGGFSYPGGVQPTDPSTFSIASVKNQAKLKAVAKIRAAQTSMQSLVAMGEFGETVRLVNGSGKELFKGVCGYLKSFDKKFARGLTPQNLTRAISRRWLEFVFGWKPFISDIDDGMKAINRYLDLPKPSRTFRTSAESVEKNPQPRYSTSKAWYTIVFQPMLQSTYRCKLYGAVSLMNPLTGGALAHEYGIKLDEFVPTIWELIPFSFLADYFINIGAVISASSLNTTNVAWMNIGELRQVERSTELVSALLQAPGSYMTEETSIRFGPLYRYRRTVKDRAAFTESLIPAWEFQIPGTSTRWANMSALANLHIDAKLRLRK